MHTSGGSNDAADGHDVSRATEPPGRLTDVRAVPHDDDERPSREDRHYGQTIFTRPPVPLPRWLRGRKKKSG
jgi:hypothetical protein